MSRGELRRETGRDEGARAWPGEGWGRRLGPIGAGSCTREARGRWRAARRAGQAAPGWGAGGGRIRVGRDPAPGQRGAVGGGLGHTTVRSPRVARGPGRGHPCPYLGAQLGRCLHALLRHGAGAGAGGEPGSRGRDGGALDGGRWPRPEPGAVAAAAATAALAAAEQAGSLEEAAEARGVGWRWVWSGDPQGCGRPRSERKGGAGGGRHAPAAVARSSARRPRTRRAAADQPLPPPGRETAYKGGGARREGLPRGGAGGSGEERRREEDESGGWRGGDRRMKARGGRAREAGGLDREGEMERLTVSEKGVGRGGGKGWGSCGEGPLRIPTYCL